MHNQHFEWHILFSIQIKLKLVPAMYHQMMIVNIITGVASSNAVCIFLAQCKEQNCTVQ